jgi:metal-sulfur cluster biosynthetic enzyme
MTTHNDEVQQEAAQGPDEETVRQALRKVKDPEAGINIIDLGLVYDIAVADDSKVTVTMTLTSPACPVGPQIMGEADAAVRGVDGVADARIELVWEPYWTPERIDPKVRAYLGF